MYIRNASAGAVCRRTRGGHWRALEMTVRGYNNIMLRVTSSSDVGWGVFHRFSLFFNSISNAPPPPSRGLLAVTFGWRRFNRTHGRMSFVCARVSFFACRTHTELIRFWCNIAFLIAFHPSDNSNGIVWGWHGYTTHKYCMTIHTAWLTR